MEPNLARTCMQILSMKFTYSIRFKTVYLPYSSIVFDSTRNSKGDFSIFVCRKSHIRVISTKTLPIEARRSPKRTGLLQLVNYLLLLIR